MGTLIKNGTIVTALDEYRGDVRLAGGKIVELGPMLEANGDTIVDASGQYVFPGGLDPHVHMELPFMGTVSADDFETGTAAGLAGGTTSIIDFVIPARNEDLMEALAAWHDKAAKSAFQRSGSGNESVLISTRGSRISSSPGRSAGVTREPGTQGRASATTRHGPM